MRVIITGGRGLIGSALASRLTEDGHEVIALSRTPKYVRSLPKNVRVEPWDGRTASGWGRLVDGADAIVNLAGASIAGEGLLGVFLQRWTSGRKRLILESRLNAGRAVLQAIEAAKKKPGVLVQASAIGYYGAAREEPLAEDDPPGFDFQARVVWDWEQSTSQAEVMGVRRVVIRSGLVMSGKGGLLPVIALPFRLFLASRLGSGKQWFSWVHVADEVGAIRFLVENANARGAFNVTSPNPITNAQLTVLLRRILRRPPFIPAPAFALRLLLGEKSTLVLAGPRPVPKRLMEMGFAFKFPQAEAALRDLLSKARK